MDQLPTDRKITSVHINHDRTMLVFVLDDEETIVAVDIANADHGDQISHVDEEFTEIVSYPDDDTEETDQP